MTAYCILVINTKEQTANVSQEAYSSLEKARDFVLSRNGVVEVGNPFNPDETTNMFVGDNVKYLIKEIRVI